MEISENIGIGGYHQLNEWRYKTSFYSSSKFTPFEVVYGWQRPSYSSYSPRETYVAAIDQALKHEDSRVQLLKDNLHQAQN